VPSYKTAFGSFLKTEDLQGRAVRAVIEAVLIEEVRGDDGVEKKLVAHFVGKDKALILNRTNCESIEGIVGSDDFSAWAGHQVVLYPTTTKFGPKTVPCLRIRAVQAPAPVVPPPPPPPRVPGEDDMLDADDIGF
jgi:hypothetical protein